MNTFRWLTPVATLAVGIFVGIYSSNIPTPHAEAMPGKSARALETETRHDIPPFTFEDVTPDEQVNITVYETSNRSVVNISTKVRTEDSFFFSGQEEEGNGSGCVWDQSGHVITNNHVIEDAVRSGVIMVTLFDGSIHVAELVGRDPPNDLAVLRIAVPQEKIYPIALGDSSSLKVGLRVFVISNPFGLDRTLTTGIISSLNRTLPVDNIRTIKGVIQTDAAINPGNSGGPLLDKRGRLIGLNTAIISPVGQNSGIGFAIPVNNIRRVVPQLITFGRIIRADIGILAVYESEGTDQGLVIAKLARTGAAAESGLRGPRLVVQGRGLIQLRTLDRSRADRIISIDGHHTNTFNDLLEYVESKRPGDSVQVKFARDGQLYEVLVRLRQTD